MSGYYGVWAVRGGSSIFGHDRLQYRVGQMLRDGVGTEANPEQAAYYFERSAVLGNPHAQYALAKQYLQSREPEKVMAALELLKKSAKTENSTALYALGKLHLDGEGIPQDIPAAIRWLTASAEQNNQFAQGKGCRSISEL